MLAAPSLTEADLPTPAELDFAPELAILVALERCGLDLDERDATPLLSWLADDITRQLEALGVSLARYRQAFAYARRLKSTAPDDTPF
jgi:hypothetical protein